MALSRRGAGRFSTQIWPGFVDAMTALILVLFALLFRNEAISYQKPQ